ncbi:MAG: hypothetical protein J1E00_06170 [Oscillospiraceae bacterium]|nr:hypothetical protein [Oscillospiraceae bacterium]
MNWQNTFDTTVHEGIFALLILQVLSEGDKDRQELHREIGVRTDGVFCRTNSLLQTLRELLLRKWITSYVIPIDETHRQTIYRIEDSGKDYLQYGRIHLKNVTTALRLFFDWEAPPKKLDEKSPLS